MIGRGKISGEPNSRKFMALADAEPASRMPGFADLRQRARGPRSVFGAPPVDDARLRNFHEFRQRARLGSN
jgi:hypothetical protein